MQDSGRSYRVTDALLQTDDGLTPWDVAILCGHTAVTAVFETAAESEPGLRKARSRPLGFRPKLASEGDSGSPSSYEIPFERLVFWQLTDGSTQPFPNWHWPDHRRTPTTTTDNVDKTGSDNILAVGTNIGRRPMGILTVTDVFPPCSHGPNSLLTQVAVHALPTAVQTV